MIDFLEETPLSEPLIFDSHAHYDDAKFDGICDELLESLPRHGVCGVINCGCDTVSSKRALAFAEKYPYIYAAVGVHPENIGGGTAAEIWELTKHKKWLSSMIVILLDRNDAFTGKELNHYIIHYV